MNTSIRRLSPALALLLTAAAWSADPSAAPATTGGATRPALTVTVVTPQQQLLQQTLPANGSLAAWQEAVIGAESSGLAIAEVRVNVGDVVKRGQVLATLQTATLKAELLQTEASLAEATANAAEAQAQADRARQLQQQGFFSQAQLTQALASNAAAQARLQAARAQVQLQQQRLAQTEVRAPDNGVVSARLATPGAVVNPGTELFRLIRQGRLEWRAEVTASELGRIQTGASASLTAASGQTLQGRVRMVAPTVDPLTRNALVYVDLNGPLGSARAGMFARGAITLGQQQAVTVPQSAIVVRDGFTHVFSVDADQKVNQHKVQTGRLQGDRMEVLSGLPAGARVVASGGAFLNQGDTVRVTNGPAAQ